MANRTIAILTLGSRGDVQPYIALGLGLQQAGDRVIFVTEPSFQPWVEQYGLSFAPLRANFVQLAKSAQGKAAIVGQGNPWSLIQSTKAMMRDVLEDAWLAAQHADAVVYHPKALAGYHIADKLNIPGFLALMLPAYSPTRAFANPALGAHDWGAWLNRLSYDALGKLALAPYRGLINTWRHHTLELPPTKHDTHLGDRPVPKIYAYSRHVVPIPSDWDDFTLVSGYWFLPTPADWVPPEPLQAFLNVGPPPIYVGFGSMPSVDAERTTSTVLEAAKQTGQRLVLATGWGGLQAQPLPDNVYLLDAVPHDWLFPYCAAVVHHGGAGTTGAGLRAGKPTVICPFFGDQPFWGQRVYELGVGSRPIPQKRLNVEQLAGAIAQVTRDFTMQAKAAQLGQAIRAEDGIATAIHFINQHLS
ncbi:glycosyltransferase [Leptolyngbya sp. AN02str]|uniref:glycosyltransferase n=1 Tax=Leptolyngbya sp. AN02str TaxID=3423363 RepID=UPI003D315460